MSERNEFVDDLLPFNDPKYIAEPYGYWSRLRD